MATGILPPWSYPSVFGKSLLNRNGVSHGAGLECRFTFEGGGRRGRRRSPKGVVGTGCAGICSWHIFGFWRFPCRGRFHAKKVSSGMKTIDGIFPRCFRNNTYITIPGLHKSFGGKPDDNRPTRQDGGGRMIGAACCPKKVGSSGCALYGVSE